MNWIIVALVLAIVFWLGKAALVRAEAAIKHRAEQVVAEAICQAISPNAPFDFTTCLAAYQSPSAYPEVTEKLRSMWLGSTLHFRRKGSSRSTWECTVVVYLEGPEGDALKCSAHLPWSFDEFPQETRAEIIRGRLDKIDLPWLTPFSD